MTRLGKVGGVGVKGCRLVEDGTNEPGGIDSNFITGVSLECINYIMIIKGIQMEDLELIRISVESVELLFTVLLNGGVDGEAPLKKTLNEMETELAESVHHTNGVGTLMERKGHVCGPN